MSVNEQSISKLQDAWVKYQVKKDTAIAIEKALQDKKSFDEWSKNVVLSNMTLDQYTNLLGANKDGIENGYFTHWMERKTATCGKFRTASSYAYGIYRMKDDGGDALYMTSEYRGKLKDKPPLKISAAETYFKEIIRPAVCDAATFKDRDNSPLDINYTRKIAYIYNPEKLLPIFKKDVIEAIAEFIGIEVDSSSYKASQAILDEIKVKWALPEPDFVLTQKLGQFLFNTFENTFIPAHKNIIFYGAPGTGKTYKVQGIKARILIDGHDENEVLAFAQFHPSYSYEDFIEGFKPTKEMSLELTSGCFKRFCKKAMGELLDAQSNNRIAKKYYFVADEINRAELSRVLGEVLVCLEESKRVGFNKEGKLEGLKLKTQYGHLDCDEKAVYSDSGIHYFCVPNNLYFIGTMNSTDRSIDSFDLALRRRFVWHRMACDYEVLSENIDDARVIKYIEICKALNKLIVEEWQLGQDFEIGHAYFLDVGNKISKKSVESLFISKIAPLLREYLRAEYGSDEIDSKIKAAAQTFSLDEVEKTQKNIKFEKVDDQG